MSSTPSPIDQYLSSLCERAGLVFVQADCQADEPGCMAVDGDGVREFYSLSNLLNLAAVCTVQG